MNNNNNNNNNNIEVHTNRDESYNPNSGLLKILINNGTLRSSKGLKPSGSMYNLPVDLINCSNNTIKKRMVMKPIMLNANEPVFQRNDFGKIVYIEAIYKRNNKGEIEYEEKEEERFTIGDILGKLNHLAYIGGRIKVHLKTASKFLPCHYLTNPLYKKPYIINDIISQGPYNCPDCEGFIKSNNKFHYQCKSKDGWWWCHNHIQLIRPKNCKKRKRNV